MIVRSLPWTCVVFLMLAACGCEDTPELYPVGGVVVFSDGTPVSHGTVEFYPIDGGSAARGEIGPDGRFTLMTEGHDGAVPGPHRVAINQTVAILDERLSAHVRDHQRSLRINPAYANPDTSGLERDVRDGDANQFRFELNRSR